MMDSQQGIFEKYFIFLIQVTSQLSEYFIQLTNHDDAKRYSVLDPEWGRMETKNQTIAGGSDPQKYLGVARRKKIFTEISQKKNKIKCCRRVRNKNQNMEGGR